MLQERVQINYYVNYRNRKSNSSVQIRKIKQKKKGWINMKELTDAMLSQDMVENGVIVIVLPVIILLLALLIIIRNYFAKKQAIKNSEEVAKKEYKGYGYKISIIVIILVIGIIFLNIGNFVELGKNNNWYLTYEPVLKKCEEMGTSDSGTRKTSYYVVVEEEEEVLVTKEEYRNLNEGDFVYVLRYEDGSATRIYPADEYKYTGSMLREK